MWTWYNAEIIKIEQESPNTRRFWVQILEDEIYSQKPFHYEAGQFITMYLPIEAKRLQRWRSYSIANAPVGDERTLEFCISRFEGGLGTAYLFDVAKVGTVLKFKGADGTFTLSDTQIAEKDLVFVCTGTGIAPFRAMLQDIFLRQLPHRSLHLIFGTRTETDILYFKEMQNLAQQYAAFDYDVTLSRSENSDFQKGYVHAIYETQYKTVRPDVAFYLCGWSRMIDEARRRLEIMGYPTSQVFYELYG